MIPSSVEERRVFRARACKIRLWGTVVIERLVKGPEVARV